ncbi:TonB-dependent receptor [Brevundimonas sp.]|uniref:TonB-dependent receptor n=1 Tax=Brevundimonas sp. TaxID=1871086 RepID=UPI0035AF6CFF
MIQPAPPPPEPVTQLEEVVVTAARLPPAASEAAFSVIRLDGEELSRSARLDEALGAVPAVSLFRRTTSLSANPTTQGISLRAIAPSGAGRTLVTLDGVPLNDPFGGWVIWSQVPPESLAGLDIVRGAGAGPYGAGALTGVIQLRDGDGGELAGSVSEYGGARLAGAGSVTVGETRLTVSGLREVSDGYVPVRGPERGAADMPLDLDVRAAAIRLDAPVGEATLSLRAGSFEEERGSGVAGSRASASGDVLSATLAQAPTQVRAGWRVQAWRRTSDLTNSFVAVADDRSSTSPAASQDETPATGTGVNAAWRVRREGLEAEIGADGRWFEGETRERFRFMQGDFTRSRIAGGEASVVGAYADGSWTAGPWLVAGGLRLDRWESTDGSRLERDRATGDITLDNPAPDRSGEVVSARLGGRYAIAPDLAVRAAAYTGFRPATLNELHRPFRVGNDITEANAALEPERLAGVELGLLGSWGQSDATTWTATLFWNRIDDAIVNVTIGEGPGTFPVAGFVPAGGVLRQRQNAGSIEAVGIEGELSHAVSDRLTLAAAVALTDAEVDGGAAAPQLTSLRPAQAPRASATLSADWTPVERLNVFARVRYESARFDDDLNSRELSAAWVLDARASWAMTDRLALELIADNLLDEDVEVSRTGDNVAGYGPPRTLGVGLRARF